MIKQAHPLLLAAVLLPLALHAGHAHAQQDINKVNGSITAQAGQYYGDLATVNGGIRIESSVQARDAETVNGGITVENDVTVQGLSTVNGSIRAGTGLHASGSIETVNGDVFVDRGAQLNSVSTVSGSIGLVQAGMAGGVETVNGNITIGAGSHLKGGITVRKPTSSWISLNLGKRKPPRIVIGANAAVDGPLLFERDVKLYVHQSASTGKISGATPIRYHGNRAPAD